MLEKKRHYIYDINNIKHISSSACQLSNKTPGTKLSLDNLLSSHFLIPVRRPLLLGEDLDIRAVLEAGLIEKLIGQFGRLGVEGLQDEVHDFLNVGDRVNDRVEEIAAELGESLQELYLVSNAPWGSSRRGTYGKLDSGVI